MRMGITRQLNYSFMYFLLEELSLKVEQKVLSTSDGMRFKIPHPNIVVTKPIHIYLDGEVVDRSEYKIYPLLGDVVFEKRQDGIVAATYNYSIVNVIGHTQGDFIRPPLIAFENSMDSDYNFELGSTVSETESLFFIHLYGANMSQRDDLSDMIKKSLKKTLLIYDYSKGFPLANDGSISNVDIPIVNSAEFTRVNVKKNPLESTDEIEIGRALVSAVCRYIS